MTTVPAHSQAHADSVPSQFEFLIRWREAAAAVLNRWFARLDAILAGKQAWISAISFVLVLQIVLTTWHRPWLDEWQALQLAVQSPHLSDLMLNLRYEGHPPLWYLILRGLSTLVSDPARALTVAALAIAIPVQLTILLAAPFSRAERLMLALSEFVLFEYLTLSRSLTLGIAIMFAITALWKRPRLVWLLIAVLPLCDFLFGVVSMLFVALRWRERRIFWPFAALWVVSGVFAAWSIRPMPDIGLALVPDGPGQEFPLWLTNMATLGLPLQWHELVPRWNSPPPPAMRWPALIGFFAVAWIELRKRPDFALAFGVFVGVLLAFDLAIYELSIRHLSMAALLLILFVWRMSDDGALRSAWWRAWLLVIAVCGVSTAAINLSEPFDTAPEAVALIKQMGLRDKEWVAFPRPAGQGIAALSGMMFERLDEHCSEDFMHWNATGDHLVGDVRALKPHLRAKVAQDGRFYVVSWDPLPEYPMLLHRIGHVNRRSYDGQAYYFYVAGNDHFDARPHNQPCAGPHKPLFHRVAL